jgi:hypothetical protein
MLSSTELRKLYRTGVPNTLRNLLNRVRTKRQVQSPTLGNRQGAAIRNFRRTEKQLNTTLIRIENHADKMTNARRRLRNNHPNLQGGTFNQMRNAIRALPTRNANGKPIAKTNDMKLFLNLHNKYQQLGRNVLRNRQAHLNSVMRVIRSSPVHSAQFNIHGVHGGNDRLETLAKQVIRNLELQKGRTIRNIVKAQMASPHTAIGRKLLMARMP